MALLLSDLLALVVIPNPLTIAADASLQVAIALLSQEMGDPTSPARGNGVLVCDNRRLQGLVTLEMVMPWVVAGRDLAQGTVAEVMLSSPPVLTVKDLRDLEQALARFGDDHCPALPLVNENHEVLGIVSHRPLRAIWQRQQDQARTIQLERERMIARLSNRIHASLDLGTILEIAVTEMRTFLACDRVLIYRFAPDWSGEVITESVGEGWPAILHRTIHDPCFAGKAMSQYSNGHKIAVTDITQYGYTPCYVSTLTQLAVKSNLVVPILVEGNLWGLFIAHHCAAPQAWREGDLPLLDQVAVQLAIAIQQSLSYQKLAGELRERQRVEMALQETLASLQTLNQELEQRVIERTQQIRVKEAQLQGFLDHAHDLIQYVDVYDGCFTYVNQAWLQKLGYRREEIIAKPMVEMVSPRYASHCQMILQQVGEGAIGSFDNLELVFLSKTQAEIVVEGNLTCRYEDNRPVEIQIIFRDVTQRRQMEQRLQTSEARHRALMDGAGDAIILFDEQGTILEGNRQAIRLLGYDPQTLIARSWLDLIPPDRQSDWLTFWQQVQGGEIQHFTNTQLQDHQGQAIPVDITGTAITIGHQTILQGIFRDIRDRKTLENLYRQIVETAGEGIWMISPQGITTFVNIRMAQMLGTTPQAMLGSTLADFIDPQAQSHTSQLSELHSASSAELSCQVLRQQHDVCFLRPDGQRLWTLLDITPMFNEQGEMTGTLAMVTDITQRKQTEVALQEENTFRQQILNIMTDGLAVFHYTNTWPFLHYTLWNPQMEAITGYRREEINEQGAMEHLFSEEHRPTAYDRLEQLLQGNNLAKEEWLIYDRRGHERFVSISTIPLSTYEGYPQWLAIWQDITEQRHAQQALHKSEERLRRYFEQPLVGMAITDVHCLWLDVNDCLCQLLGYTYNELAQTTWIDLTHPEDLERDLSQFRRVIAGEIDGYRLDKRFIRKDGSPLHSSVAITCLRNHDGSVHSLVTMIQDIGDRKGFEERLRHLVNELSVFKQALDESALVSITDAKGNITYANNRFVEVAGYSLQELIGQSHRLLKSDVHDATLYHDLWRTITQGKVWRGELCNRTKGGELYWVDSTIVPFVNDHGQPHQYLSIRFDITARKQAEKALERQLAAVNAAVDGIAILQDGLYVALNQAHLDLFGYTEEELLYQSWTQLYGSEEIARFEQEVFPALSAHGHWQGEAIATRHDGTTFPEGLSLTLANEGFLICVCRDITRQRAYETRLRQDTERANLLREITQRIRQSLDLSMIFDTAVQEIRSLFQADRVAILQFTRIPSFDQGEFIAESVAPGLPVALHQRINDQCFGEKYAPLYVKGRIHVMEDVENADIRESCYLDELQAFQIRANLVIPLLKGGELWGLICINQCDQPRQWQDFEIAFGQQIAAQLAIALQQAELVQQLQKELTERQQAQIQLTETNERLAYSNEELARATRLKDEFLASMSHELRTPLNAILGMTEGLQELVFGDLNDRQKKAIATVERSGRHLLELINDILDLSKIEAGKLELQPEDVPIGLLCRSSLTFVKQLAHQKQIRLEAKIPENLSQRVLYLDQRRMRQVLINLLSNAVKFTPAEGRVSLVVYDAYFGDRVAEDPLENEVCFAVCDTGIGISVENQPRLFQPFVQIDSRLNRQYSGTGLGLALVKSIIDLHEGRISLQSEEGKGSCFAVYLPGLPPAQSFAPDPLPSLPSPVQAIPSPLSPANPQRTPTLPPVILLAEDNEANVTTLSSYLTVKGYRLVVANNGLEAIRMLQIWEPDLILMDIQMPEMDGFQAIQHIRTTAKWQHIPIIALTAFAMENDRQRCVDAGASDYLAKPVKLKELATKIQQWLASREGDR